MTFYPEHSTLGKKTAYASHYDSEKLFPIARTINREKLGLYSQDLPFYGFDLWNHYEVSWLNQKGKPIVAIAEIIYDCRSPNIIESKSMKLYFNSFNNTQFENADIVETQIKHDLAEKLQYPVIVKIIPLYLIKNAKLVSKLEGIYLDDLDIECTNYHHNPTFLMTENNLVEETLFSDLLKSNCLVTNQPDWCSLQIHYKGNKINHSGLLNYIVSFRNDNEFHEQCIEKIFLDIQTHCNPEKLTVYGRSTRRGGIDINSIRSTEKMDPLSILNQRLFRQ